MGELFKKIPLCQGAQAELSQRKQETPFSSYARLGGDSPAVIMSGWATTLPRPCKYRERMPTPSEK
jgi:hypothetical protein